MGLQYTPRKINYKVQFTLDLRILKSAFELLARKRRAPFSLPRRPQSWLQIRNKFFLLFTTLHISMSSSRYEDVTELLNTIRSCLIEWIRMMLFLSPFNHLSLALGPAIEILRTRGQRAMSFSFHLILKKSLFYSTTLNEVAHR